MLDPLIHLNASNLPFFFVDTKRTNPDEYGGGGILIRTMASPSVPSLLFINNYCGRYSAGITLVYSNSPTQHIILSRRFIKCVSEGISADGTGAVLWNNELSLGLLNYLFAFCTSTSDGGALFILLPSPRNGTVIRFYFFHANHATG